MNSISSIKRFIQLAGMCLFTFVTVAQSRAIYIVDIGPADGGILPTLILRDSNDINNENLYELMPEFIGVFGFNYSTHHDFDLLECTLRTELKSSENKDFMYWKNFRIVFLDESLKVSDERYICCDKETAKTFKRLLKLKSVSSNQFISGLFSNYLKFFEENNNR